MVKRQSAILCLAGSLIIMVLFVISELQSKIKCGFKLFAFVRQGEIFLLPFSIIVWAFVVLEVFVFYYKFETIYYCLVFALCLKNEHFFFFIMDKMLGRLEVFSTWLGEIFIVSLSICTRIWSFFNRTVSLLSSACVSHFICTLVWNKACSSFQVIKKKNKLDIKLDEIVASSSCFLRLGNVHHVSHCFFINEI